MSLHPAVERILAARGIDADGLCAFLDPALSRLLPPDSLPGVRDAVTAAMPFLRDGRKIVVFGDYDCDGVCASAILVSSLRRLGAASAAAFIPDRFSEGYGMTSASLERLFREHPDVALVITVDNGVSAIAETAALKRRGVAVVVTDHHIPGAELPAADAIVNPKVASAAGMEELCGAGVAFFLANALAKAAVEEGLYSGPRFGGRALVLAGLATAADMVPLTGQNRILVAQTLRNFRACAPVGLRELYARAARRPDDAMRARDLAFTVVPRINAAGRMSSAMRAFRLLVEEDREKARRMAFDVDSRNTDRKTEEQRVAAAARAAIGGAEPGGAIVVRGEDWHPGVIGIVAARLMDEYGVPCAVVSGSRGSCRAPEGFNVYNALSAASQALERFGGHASAGGFEVKSGAFDRFETLFREDLSRQTAVLRESGGDAPSGPDLWIEPGDISMELLNDLEKMEPFGIGNPEPVFGLRGVTLADARPVGMDGSHATLSFAGGKIPRAVWWRNGRRVEELRALGAKKFDILFTLFASDFGEEGRHPELSLTDVRVSPCT